MFVKVKMTIYIHSQVLCTCYTEGEADTPLTEENKSSTYETVQEHEQRSIIALRTVPVVLKHWERRLQVNRFLDEGNDTSYVNEEMVEELGLDGSNEKEIINVANDQKVNLMSATMKIGLESLDGRVDTVIVAKTSNNIWWDKTHQLAANQRPVETFQGHSF